MKKRLLSLCMAVVLVLLTFGAVPAIAETLTEGNFKYTVADDAATVTVTAPLLAAILPFRKPWVGIR